MSLLICTSGRAGKLDRCLRSVEAGRQRPEQLVVVNGDDRDTPTVVQRYAGSFAEVVLVRHPNRNLATLRNLGLPRCAGDVVAMTDDDAVVDQRWLAALRAAHGRRPEAGGVGGPVRGLGGTFASRVADAVVFPEPMPGQSIVTLPTVNMSYKRHVIETVGGFDESLFRGEDVDYNWRVVEAGFPLVWEPGMVVAHEHRPTVRGLYQQQWMYGRAYVLVRGKWPAMYAVYPHELKSVRSWAKLAHAGLAILYQPLGISRKLTSPRDRLAGYPVLVAHHLVWKLGMAWQAASAWTNRTGSARPVDVPVVSRWRDGVLVSGPEPT